MKLKSKLLLALLAVSGVAFADETAPQDSLSYNVGVVSQYRYRGLAQSRGMPALQGGADFAAANGFYVGTWASTIKWIQDSSNSTATVKGPVELDIYGGYKFEAAGVAYDVGVLQYEYLGNNLADTKAAHSPNTSEVYGAATLGVVTAKYSYSLTDLFGQISSAGKGSAGSYYLDLSATFDLGNGYTFVPHAGRQQVKNVSDNSYTDYALTVNKDFGNGLSASLSAIAVTADKTPGSAFYSTANNYSTAKGTLVAGIKYAF
ncbi:MAG: hypothetical protein RLY90_1129 [Pseudomonadota bacterium]